MIHSEDKRYYNSCATFGFIVAEKYCNTSVASLQAPDFNLRCSSFQYVNKARSSNVHTWSKEYRLLFLERVCFVCDVDNIC